MVFDELEDLGDIPSNGVLCLLCKQKLIIRRGDLTSFEEHLRRTHAVYNNINWIIENTLRSQNRKGLVQYIGQKRSIYLTVKYFHSFIEKTRRRRRLCP